MLDVDHGTYPYVTSSSTVAGQAASGSGTGPNNLDYFLGIVKAYTTRVGEGPFPTELFDEIGKGIGERGHEFGTVTGLARRCGWFDAIMVHQACCVGGIDGLSLTKLDVLDGVEELKICIGYKLGDKILDYFPSNQKDQAAVEPIYETLEGWQETNKAHVLGRIYLQRPLNLYAALRNWLVALLPWFQHHRSAMIQFW